MTLDLQMFTNFLKKISVIYKGAAPSVSAMLYIKATPSCILIPRMTIP
jgi:hypothetical protein